ncbi:XRE family transcriptional regulator [Streptomyces sp. NPDC008313]|uniref:XRE family transcriptional regulator n=1 Tax=Streptomyces sp. NPDC008313 TaxID=3364826 RepID=UPI0036EB8069
MPRWKALPDELDPQVREFASQLRRLVDRSGLSIAAVADRTGYSKTSWERYLGGRLLAPKGAIVALAEVTGTDPVHLTTMWELAERAWSRSEMRRDMTMEAIRISQARAALGDSGAPPAPDAGGTASRGGGGATGWPGIAGPAGVSPTVPPQGAGPGGGWPPSGGAAHGGDREAGVRPDTAGVRGSAGSPGPAGAFGPAGPPEDARPPGAGSPGGARGRRWLTAVLAGVGALVVVAAALYVTRDGGETKDETATKKPSVSATTRPGLPAGVKCAGEDCTGEDPETMGCGGELAETTDTATVGTAVVEVRYSRTCRAAWARITQAAGGDRVEVSSATAKKQTGTVDADADTDAYTPMVAVKDAGDVKACAALASGTTGCTG